MNEKDPTTFLQGLSRQTTIMRNAQGRWFHDGEMIPPSPIAQAFDRWLDKAPDGRYCLRNSIHWVYVTIEGAPFFVRSLHEKEQALWVALSNHSEERLDLRTLRQGKDGALYCTVMSTFAAQFDNAAAMLLTPYLAEKSDGIYVKHGKEEFRVPIVEHPLDS